MTGTKRNAWTKACEALHPHFGRKSEKCGKVWWGINQREPQSATRELLELKEPCHSSHGSPCTTSHPKMQSRFLQVPTGSKKAHFSEWKCQTVAKSGQLFALCHHFIPESDGALQEESSEMTTKILWQPICTTDRLLRWWRRIFSSKMVFPEWLTGQLTQVWYKKPNHHHQQQTSIGKIISNPCLLH